MAVSSHTKKHVESPNGAAKFLNPQSLLDVIGIKAGMVVADFGCGAGYFTILLGRKVGFEGMIYAIDIQRGALESARSRAKFFGLAQIQTIHGDLEREKGSTLDDKSVDMALCANILFQVKNKSAVIQEAKRITKKRGKLVMIEWKPTAPWGPESRLRTSHEEFIDLAEKAGFTLEKEFAAGSHHYGLIFSL